MLEVLVFIAVLLAICLLLVLLAITIRSVLVRIANRNGHTADAMPMHYHMFAIGIYFTILFIGIGMTLWLK